MADTFYELKKLAEKTSLLDSIIKLEAELTDLTPKQLRHKVEHFIEIMHSAIKNGLNSTEPSKSSLVGFNAALLNKPNEYEFVSPLCKKSIKYALAVIEENARMGKIVACPTAGSSGIVPAVLIAAYEDFSKTKDELVNSLIIAGEIGRIISNKVPLAGAIAGCQAECGVASAMASAGLVYLLGGDIDIIYNAVALNLKNVLGLTCDPVAGLVEVPCVKRNAFLASHAITSAYVALCGVKSCIDLDNVIDAMAQVGNLMSPKLKESSEAGLATTKCGLEIKNKLWKLWYNQ